ncbi:MAG: histidinol-phosphatase [Planctomycetota bacterium]
MMADTPAPDVEARLQLAVDIAREAGLSTLELFRSDRLGLEHKGDGSPVTLADKQAEELLREQITGAFPDDAILGEEFGSSDGKTGFQWVLDPIDGTKSFITGVPLYTTLVGVLREGEPVAGVIYSPGTDEIAWAGVGGGCWYRIGDAKATRTMVSGTAELAEATCLTSEVKSFTKYRGPVAREAYDQLEAACRLTRTWGDGFGYLLVATGRADICFDPIVNLWDIAACMPVITEAGGVFTDWEGTPTVHSPHSVATNPQLAPAVLEILRGG